MATDRGSERILALEFGFGVVKIGEVTRILVPVDREIHAISLEGEMQRSAIIHHSTKPGYKLWQVSYFSGIQAGEDETWDTLQEALDSARAHGLLLSKAL